MAQNKIRALQNAIDKKGYAWKAGRTSVSELSVAKQGSILGLAVSSEEIAATQQAIKADSALMAFDTAVALPSSIDWRNNSGNWVTPVKDQQSCGSCVSFGCLATIESHIRIACKNAGMNVDLSEAHLFFCGCGNCCGSGWNFAPALDFCQNTGVAHEAEFPYTPANQPCKQGVSIYTKISSWTRVLNVQARKQYLATSGPMVAGMAVYADFYGYSSGVYRRTSNTLRGYHAISVIGYSDPEECWICKNSWGTGWGESGYFKIGYGESQIDTSFAFYGVSIECPAPVDDCRRYVPFLLRVLRAARFNRQLRACLCYYVCRRGRRPRCSRRTLYIVRLVLSVLRRCPRYRLPFCRRLGC